MTMSFRDIKGQKSALGFLRKLVCGKRISGTYLFYGPEGVGKSLTALTLAKYLNCREANSEPDL